MRGDAFRLLLLLLIAAAVAPAPLGGAAQSELGSWTRQDGQWLADACTRFGERNADTTVQLPASTVVELRNATFTHANSSSVPGLRPYSNGTLLWLGSGASSSVVDTVMRAGIIPTLFTARVVFADVSVTNLCWAAQSAEDFAVHSPIIMGIFSSTMASWAVFDNRTAVYLPQSSLASMTYAQTVKRTGLHSGGGRLRPAFCCVHRDLAVTRAGGWRTCRTQCGTATGAGWPLMRRCWAYSQPARWRTRCS